jgi:predicted dinucleotide-binding enzyme
MTKISIIGSGKMSQALEGLFAKGGADVEVIGRAEVDSADFGDVVVLAVPYAALAELASTIGPKLSGKVVVDITNPVDFGTFSPIKPAEGSAAAEFAAAVPGAQVVKAFNTNFSAALAAGEVDGSPLSILLAGDPAAVSVVSELVSASGATAFAAGPLDRAAELEALGFLQIALAAGEQIGWTNGFVLVK